MKQFIQKLLKVPESNETAHIACAQLWSVRWESRSGYHLLDSRPEAEFFTSQAEAEHFAESLRSALALLRYNGKGLGKDCTKVTVSKEDGGQ